ncbi:hypothetical protein [Maribacter polysaccharolyticus]|uniref:hypothetical protein n=1 Tax=Maribacter polysaccharolyticus TaxID=3020831 RepID=UPI00237F568C|nr:hypothetical protein [Maribacter polysaccharolyticus]MDE3744084.1 hypothetical protein [Maribacter polysaccharolyticus]
MMLSQKEQIQTITAKSDFITTKYEHGVYFELYAIGLFFVEIEKEYSTKKILNVSIFATGRKLDRYAGELMF